MVGNGDGSPEGATISLSPILNVVECIICLQTLKIPFKQCKTGHLMCSACSATLTKCPLCKEMNFWENSTFVKQLLETLKPLCKYSSNGCDAMYGADSHETYCQFRPVNCKQGGCRDKVPLSRLLQHYRSSHGDRHVFTDANSSIRWVNFKYCDNKFENVPIFTLGHFFWLERTCRSGLYRMSFHMHPIGHPSDDFFISISLNKLEQGLTYKLKANLDNVTNDLSTTCLQISRNSIEWFISEEGILEMDYAIYSKTRPSELQCDIQATFT